MIPVEITLEIQEQIYPSVIWEPAKYYVIIKNLSITHSPMDPKETNLGSRPDRQDSHLDGEWRHTFTILGFFSFQVT